MRYRVLGPLEVSEGSGPIPLGGPKQRLVLAHLLLRANQVVAAEHLIDALWGEEPPEAARGTLQAYVSRLRSAVGTDRIEGRPPGYVVRADPQELDVLAFESLMRDAERLSSEPRATLEALSEALELWRGPALSDLASEPSLQGDIARLEELRLKAGEERIAAQLEVGSHGEVVAELESLVADHPLRERLWGSLMLALYRSGRQAEAVSTFQRAREILANELGIDPSKELMHLHERILRQDPDLDVRGEPLRGYRLLEQIGEGAFGVVHRALQPQVGREVAIKAVHPELANHPDFVRRFEREAQLVARLEHPHVVPLYDYWREPDAAYLVMRFLRGGSLTKALETGTLEIERSAAILDQVASALSAAHRQGIVHRDVKPDNILLDEEGNAYLTDFGVALDAGAPEKTSGALLRGTPAYLSPEQIRLEPATSRSDVYALGVVLYEILTGAHPFPDASPTALLDRHLSEEMPSVRVARPELSAAIDDVVRRATARDPNERFSDAADVAAAFRRAVGGARAVREPVAETRNPYKGLRAFLEADAVDFFGRETLTNRLLQRLGENDPSSRFLAVVGPSGSGKSSVVRAGLVPALRNGALPGSERWYVVELLPGAEPLRELERALLGIAIDPPSSVLGDLQRDERGLVRAVDRVLPDPDAELLIVLDQLEELFTLVQDDAERSHVLASLRAAALEPGSRIRIVATLRADFFDQPLSVRGFGDLLASRTEAITPMSPEELERAIVGPADPAGLVVEPRLLAAMIADVVDRPGTLPLLQYALTELAERQRDGVLTLDAYRRIGGVSGALARRAEQLFDAVNETARDACRQLFLRLVTLGEGSEDTRRRVRRSELIPLADASAMEGVIEAFGRHRLLSFDRDPATREPTVEIAHEALLGAWGRLRGWVDDARDDIRTQRQLADAAAEWESGGRDRSFLLRGARLEQAASWADTTTLALSSSDREYLDAGLEQRDDEIAARRAAQDRERALERRSIRRLRALVAVGLAAALVASTLTVLTVQQRGTAERQTRVATARELAAAADANLDVDPERSILLALQAIEATRRDGTVLQEAEQALHRAVQADRLIFTIQHPSTANVAYGPDGRLLATGGTAGGSEQLDALLWDARTGALVHTLSGHTADITSVAFSADGTRLVTTADDDLAIVWSTSTGERVLTVPGRKGQAAGGSFSPDGARLALAGTDGIRVVDAATGQELQTIREPGVGFCGAAFSPDGERLTAGCGDNGDLPVWNLATGQRELTLHEGGSGAVFSPDGSRLATRGIDGTARVWDARTGRETVVLQGHTGEVFGVAWSSDGSRLATGGTDGTARVWDSATGRQLLELAGHTGLVAMVGFSPDGSRLLTGGGDGTAKVWDVSPSGGAEWFTGIDAYELYSVAYSPDSSSLLATGFLGGWSWDAATGERIRSYVDLHVDAGFAPGGERVFGAGYSSIADGFGARILDATSGEELRAFHVRGFGWSLASSPDGSLIASAAEAGNVVLWDASSGARVRTLGEPSEELEVMDGLAFSPDGTLLAGLQSRGRLRVWDVSSGEELLSFQAHTGIASAVEFSPDGTMLASSGGDGAALWNVGSGHRIAALAGSGSVSEVAFSSDGRLLATAGNDGAARIWDVSSAQETLALGGATKGLTDVAFSPDGTRLATVSIDGALRVYVLRLEELIPLARARLTRGFTQAECRQHLHVTTCPTSLRFASPTPSGPEASDPAREGPQGAYRVTIGPSDLRVGGLPGSRIRRNVGDYTLTVVGDDWQLHLDRPNGNNWDTSGTFTVSGDRITFTDRADLWCFGSSWSGRWSLGRMHLSFTDTTSTVAPTCDLNDAWAGAVFESQPWSRIGYHALGG